jgi:hypothetical protein
LTAGVSLRHAHAHSAFGRATLLRIFDALAAATDAVGYAEKQWKLFQSHRRGNNKVGNIKVDAGFVDVTSVCKPRLALAVVWIVRTANTVGIFGLSGQFLHREEAVHQLNESPHETKEAVVACGAGRLVRIQRGRIQLNSQDRARTP